MGDNRTGLGRRWAGWLSVGVLSLGLATGAGLGSAAIASEDDRIDSEMLDFLLTPLDTNLLQPGVVPSNSAIVTSRSVSQSGLTVPSLWWVQEQFGGKLLSMWLAYPAMEGLPPRVDLVVNAQAWSLYNYVERYTFVNHFGVSSQDFGYNVRVFSRQGDLLAAYVCENQAIASTDVAVVPDCRVFLDTRGAGSLTGRPSRSDGFSATGAGIVGP